jgi:hypothetical protein
VSEAVRRVEDEREKVAAQAAVFWERMRLDADDAQALAFPSARAAWGQGRLEDDLARLGEASHAEP